MIVIWSPSNMVKSIGSSLTELSKLSSLRVAKQLDLHKHDSNYMEISAVNELKERSSFWRHVCFEKNSIRGTNTLGFYHHLLLAAIFILMSWVWLDIDKAKANLSSDADSILSNLNAVKSMAVI